MSKEYMNADELLAENLQLHESLLLASNEIDNLKNLLEVARNENLKVYQAYFRVSEKLRAYERMDKKPLLKGVTNDQH